MQHVAAETNGRFKLFGNMDFPCFVSVEHLFAKATNELAGPIESMLAITFRGAYNQRQGGNPKKRYE